MQSSPNAAAVPSARDHLVQALELFDATNQAAVAARVSDILDLLDTRLPKR